MAKPKQMILLLGRMAKEIEKMLIIKVNAAAFTSDSSFDVDLRLVWYGGLAVNATGIYSLLGTYSE
ncbi:hypothetical protein [Metasolibacillus meyeri]|uniref:hypothetical protein n=1 Tax=Metasolibacillus meyeri TaxID=1071052 RepID=UPI000D2FAA79|nr:hypothetical protein [Metasolibacillus meyeri]